jgi:carbon-monoxide dehydrogenase catalytic subunit
MANIKIEDSATAEVLEIANKEKISTVWDRSSSQDPHCGFGLLGLCCKNCNLGPCRIDPFGEGAQFGVCGADADIIAARNLVRHIAAGSACHSDHGRDIAKTLYLAATQKDGAYKVRDEEKLRRVAGEYEIKIDSTPIEEIGKDLALKIFDQYGQQEGELVFLKRAPKKQQEIWKKHGIVPRGIDREVVEAMSRTNMGVDNDYRNLLLGGMKVALSDGWGGSMVATELSDILFGSPSPVRAKANLGVLKEDEVNLLIHGHEPTLSDVIVEVSRDPELIALAKEKGAKGINVAGICCTANEVLIRRGIPVAGNFLQQELAIVTGAVEAMVVDIQCIMPSLSNVASCFHTKVISTHPKAKFPGVEHIEFSEEKAIDVAKEIVKTAVLNYPNRDRKRVRIPRHQSDLIAGFTAENVFYHLGGTYRGTYRPLNDAIIAGRIRGVAAVVGCDNPKLGSGANNIALVKELIRNDVLVVQTGCAATECGKAGLLTPEAAIRYAGEGLREICKAVGIPPVLHTGACVDNSRILIECCEMVKEGGIGNGIDELPVAGAAPEWMSEKAIAIGWYCVASGIFVLFGNPMPISGSRNVMNFVTEEVEGITGGKWAFESDPVKGAHLMINHIDKKRRALKLRPMMYKQEYEMVEV